MFQIICPECKNPNPFEIKANRPVECSFCFTSFTAEMRVEEVADSTKGKLIGLKLIYQKTSETIEIKEECSILGRENIGTEIFSVIKVNGNPVVSRKHCSISQIDCKFFILDEGSTNGTFYGVNKINCAKIPMEIENNSIIFIGQEAFLVQFVYEDLKETNANQTNTNIEDTKKPVKYRCKEGCGFESETPVEICPKCMASNSMVGIYE
jgi:Zn finger protein HypA/HybF involved in hydrogenase expression